MSVSNLFSNHWRHRTLRVLMPKPSPFPLIRVGGDVDGAYLVPDCMDELTHCFSPGVSDRKTFEDNLSEQYQISCHLCDLSASPDTMLTPIIPEFQTFDKLYLSPAPKNNCITLRDFVRRYALSHDRNLLLQMDIEGGEYDIILGAERALLRRFAVIVVEFHGLQRLLSMNSALNYISSSLLKLDADFVCVHSHANNCCGQVLDVGTGLNLPGALEATFLRRDYFHGINKRITNVLHWPTIPHPLDLVVNVPNLPPILLNHKWCSSGLGDLAPQRLLIHERLYILFKNLVLKVRR